MTRPERSTRPTRAIAFHRLWLPIVCGAFHVPAVLADQNTATASNSNGGRNPVTVNSRLDFTINLGKYLFLRVGTGAFPAASGTVDTVALSALASIPAVPTSPVNGSSVGVNWNGTAPSFTAPSTVVLPVQVRSNAGAVSIRATATAGLTSGANSIPLSSIVITSSSVSLPAPLVPDTGTGAGVNVAGTAFSNLVTNRDANWTFSYVNAGSPAAGNYSGQITFTATAP